MDYSDLYKREAHVYPAAELIKEECHWLDEHDALEVSEALYSAGFLKLPSDEVSNA